jgi:hypothetical protein
VSGRSDTQGIDWVSSGSQPAYGGKVFRNKNISARGSANGRKDSTGGGAVLHFVVIAGLLAGAVGIFKATQVAHPWDILVCLLGSFAGCGLICCPYFSRD